MKYFIILLFAFLIPDVSGQAYSKGDTMYVIAQNGLKLRTAHSLNSEVLKIMPNGQMVIVEGTDSLYEITLSNGIKGKWVRISNTYDSITGFVLDSYLSMLPPFKFILNDKDGCWKNDILMDMANAIGKIDSFEYSNNSDGEGWYNMKFYKLNNAAKYIEHGHWEHWENELQLYGLSSQEVYQYAKSVLAHCKHNNVDLDVNYFKKNKVYIIDIYEDCCVHNIRIISEGNNFIELGI